MVLERLGRESGPTEQEHVEVIRAWTTGSVVHVVYRAAWFEGVLGYRHDMTGWAVDDETADGIAFFEIAEPLGRLATVLDPPDGDGITWWDDATNARLTRAIPMPAVRRLPRWRRSRRRR